MNKRIPYNEYHILMEVYKNDKIHLDRIVENTNIHQTYVTATSDKLEEEGYIRIEKNPVTLYRLGKDGEKLHQEGFPERKALKYCLKNQDKIDIPDIPGLIDIEKKDIGDIIKWGGKKGWFRKEGKTLILTEKGKNSADTPGEDEKLIEFLDQNRNFTEEEIKKSIDIEKALKYLKKRGTAVKHKQKEIKILSITDKGKEFVESGIEPVKEASQLTQEMLVEGNWRQYSFKKYKIDEVLEREYPGKVNPMQKIIEETRKAFLEMGFEESFSPYVESAFWDFDALFQPQDHPAREMQDTFYMKNPKNAILPSGKIVQKIKDVHENGGDTGSVGWGYRWSIEKAKQIILRTHNTANSIRCVAGHPEPPYKIFEVGPVFRREKIDYKHLPEFCQVDGIIIDENASFASLLGTLAEFYRKMGFEKVKFKPDFFPYTEPSVGVFVRMEKIQNWIELGGAGIFRPEVTEPFGCKVPVLAWGLGLERLAMVRYNVTDIRLLYMNDIQWLRDLPLTL